MTPDAAAPDSADVARETLRLLAALQRTAAIEWRASPIPKPEEDAERVSGGGSEPTDETLATTVDVRRLAVRAEVLAAYRAVSAAATRLDAAADRWEGLSSPGAR